MKIKIVSVEFKKYITNGKKTLLNKWNETIEFFESDDINRINDELKRLCKGYEGKRFEVPYQYRHFRKIRCVYLEIMRKGKEQYV